MEIRERFLSLVASYATLYDLSNNRRVGWDILTEAHKVSPQQLRRGKKPVEDLALSFVTWKAGVREAKEPAWLRRTEPEAPPPPKRDPGPGARW